MDEDRALIYVNMLRQVGHQQGMIINEPIHVQMDDDETETFANTLRRNLNERVKFSLNSNRFIGLNLYL